MDAYNSSLRGQWALILGASSGFGEACALELAKAGMNIFGVHLDTRATLPNAQRIVSEIKAMGKEAIFFNTNAADLERRRQTLEKMEQTLKASNTVIGVFIHSLAFGTLKPFIAQSGEEAITQAQMEMTLDVMAHTLVYWTQELFARKLMVKGGRVFALTSAGSHRVWPTYGAVSAAKAALESHVRQLAFELAPVGIAVNAIRAGVADTPALRKIPSSERLKAQAQERNPSGRITTPKDVAEAIVALCHSGTRWMTGNVIGVDGGEDIVG